MIEVGRLVLDLQHYYVSVDQSQYNNIGLKLQWLGYLSTSICLVTLSLPIASQVGLVDIIDQNQIT